MCFNNLVFLIEQLPKTITQSKKEAKRILEYVKLTKSKIEGTLGDFVKDI